MKITLPKINAQSKTSAEWNAEIAGLQDQLAKKKSAIEQESSRRSDLAVAAHAGDAKASADFESSFEAEQEFTRELEKIGAVIAHARSQATLAEQVELAAAEKKRQVALDEAYIPIEESGAKIDAICIMLAEEMARLDARVLNFCNLGGTFRLRAQDLTTGALMAAGLRGKFEYNPHEKPRLARDVVRGSALKRYGAKNAAGG